MILLMIELMAAVLLRVAIQLFSRKKGKERWPYFEFGCYAFLGVLQGWFITSTLLDGVVVIGIILLPGFIYGLKPVRDRITVGRWKVIVPALFLVLFFLGQRFVLNHIGFTFLPVLCILFILFFQGKAGKLQYALAGLLLVFTYIGGVLGGFGTQTHQEFVAAAYLRLEVSPDYTIEEVDYGFRGDELNIQATSSVPFERYTLTYMDGQIEWCELWNR